MEATQYDVNGVVYKWQSASSLTGAYTDISGATARQYTLTADDTGKYIKCVVSRYATTVSSAGKGPVKDMDLKSLAIGSLTLTPAFDATKTSYTVTTSNATNTITAVASDSAATVAIKVGETAVDSGGTATWSAGENTVTITVTNGSDSKVYTVVVTKSE